MSVHLRLMTPGDVEPACELFQIVFGHPRSPNEWHWKFAQAPGLGAVNIVAVGPDGQLLAHVGAQMFEGRWDDRPVRWVHACDVMVHPDARGDLGPGNLYRQLMRALDDALQALGPMSWPLFIYGFPGERPARLGERMGLYRRLYRCQTWQSGDVPRGRWSRWSATHGWRAQAVPWSSLHTPRLAEFWCRTARPKGQGVGLIKGTAYLDWRYACHPARRYRLWLLRRAWASPQGWLITPDDGSLDVIDAALPTGLTPRTALDALGIAGGVGRWRCWLPTDHLPLQSTPIVAVEFSGRGCFHPDWPLPQFQPGDTDVF